MTQAEIRTAVRNFIKEWSTDTGAQFASDNTLLDFYIDTAMELVVMELCSYPEIAPVFLSYEDIDLTADEPDYTLTAEWMMIWKMERNVSSENPVPIIEVPMGSTQYKTYVGQTAEFPEAFTLVGSTIKFLPTPSTAKTAYAKCWFIAPETAALVEAGPVMLPRWAHRLVPIKAAEVILGVNDADTTAMTRLYVEFLKAVIRTLSVRNHQQPRFLRGSTMERMGASTRDNAFYDDSGFLD